MTQLAFVRDVDTDALQFAVVADESGAQYVWPPRAEPLFEDEEDRWQRLRDMGVAEPADEEGWLQFAVLNTGNNYIAERRAFDDPDDAIEAAREMLAETPGPRDAPPFLKRVAESFDQVAQDYPEFADSLFEDDDDEPINQQAMANLVLMALGPIDPEGPNGWLLRAQDGEPAEDDEEQIIDFRNGG